MDNKIKKIFLGQRLLSINEVEDKFNEIIGMVNEHTDKLNEIVTKINKLAKKK